MKCSWLRDEESQLQHMEAEHPHQQSSRASFLGSVGGLIRARQRSGEGVVRRNGCPKGCFWRVRFFSAPLRFSLKTPERQEKTLRGQRRNGLSPSPLFWRALNLDGVAFFLWWAQLASFFGGYVILANSELATINRPQ